jgi:hypothetical protein
MSTEMQVYGKPVSLAALLPPDVLAKLNAPTPKDKLFERELSGKKFTYVEGNYVIERLNEAFGNAWSNEAKVENWDLVAKAQQVVVHVRLKVRLADGTEIVKENFGGSEVKFYKKDHATKPGQPIDVANDIKAATMDGIKKCASWFGICADVYAGEVTAGAAPAKAAAGGNSSAAPKPAASQPQGGGSGDPLTPKQWGYIKNLCKAKGVSDEAFRKQFGKDLSKCMRNDANPVIEWLKSLADKPADIEESQVPPPDEDYPQ